MAGGIYDIIIVGGGLGSSTLAKAMAEHGTYVLVLERVQQFRDRVRGEQMHPWGVAEAKELGIYELLRTTCGHELPWWMRILVPNKQVIVTWWPQLLNRPLNFPSTIQ